MSKVLYDKKNCKSVAMRIPIIRQFSYNKQFPAVLVFAAYLENIPSMVINATNAAAVASPAARPNMIIEKYLITFIVCPLYKAFCIYLLDYWCLLDF